MIKTMRPDAAKERAEGDVIELPGGDKSVLTVGAKNNTIRVAGTKTIDYAEDVSLHRRECISGMFDRTLVIPMQINPEGIKAEYHGVLALFVPRVEHDKARRIEVRSKARS